MTKKWKISTTMQLPLKSKKKKNWTSMFRNRKQKPPGPTPPTEMMSKKEDERAKQPPSSLHHTPYNRLRRSTTRKQRNGLFSFSSSRKPGVTRRLSKRRATSDGNVERKSERSKGAMKMGLKSWLLYKLLRSRRIVHWGS